MSYKAPNPYVEKIPYKGNTSTSNSNSIMGMIGVTPNGDTTKAVLVNSWSEYIEKFALGVETPFMANTMLSHAVYGFFQNGGSLLYVARVVGAGAKKASISVTQDTNTLKFTAINEGEWGNKIAVEVVANNTSTDESGKPVADTENPYVVNVYYADTLVESFIVGTDATTTTYFMDVINTNSSYVRIDTYIGLLTKTLLKDGTADISNVSDGAYEDALPLFDKVHNLAAIGIPGQSTSDIIKALIKYTGNKPILPVLEFPEAKTSATDIVAYAKASCAGSDVVMYGPNILVADPLSVTVKTKSVSAVGHIMGTIARTIDTKGEWNAAAGTDAVLKGALGVATDFTDEERGKLNEAGVNVILTKPNYGTVIWGARSQSADTELKYVSNLTLNHTLRRNFDDAMQRFEFKNNNASLWVDITAELTGILETKRLAGAFAGNTAETCYYVKCDGTNNTKATIDKGQVICEVGYAANKPAEFIIVRVAHQISN